MDKARLGYFRDKLSRDRERLLRLLRTGREGAWNESEKEILQELSSYDNHPADLGTTTFERAKDIGLRDNIRSFLKRIDEALARVEAGTYGICERCGGPIAEARLEAVPSATLCISCKEKEESAGRRGRPVEELVLEPAFGRQEAWQLVAQYGTSDSPQDSPGAVEYGEVDVGRRDERVPGPPGERTVDSAGPVTKEREKRRMKQTRTRRARPL